MPLMPAIRAHARHAARPLNCLRLRPSLQLVLLLVFLTNGLLFWVLTQHQRNVFSSPQRATNRLRERYLNSSIWADAQYVLTAPPGTIMYLRQQVEVVAVQMRANMVDTRFRTLDWLVMQVQVSDLNIRPPICSRAVKMTDYMTTGLDPNRQP
jgi:hypothetical protein